MNKKARILLFSAIFVTIALFSIFSLVVFSHFASSGELHSNESIISPVLGTTTYGYTWQDTRIGNVHNFIAYSDPVFFDKVVNLTEDGDDLLLSWKNYQVKIKLNVKEKGKEEKTISDFKKDKPDLKYSKTIQKLDSSYEFSWDISGTKTSLDYLSIEIENLTPVEYKIENNKIYLPEIEIDLSDLLQNNFSLQQEGKKMRISDASGKSLDSSKLSLDPFVNPTSLTKDAYIRSDSSSGRNYGAITTLTMDSTVPRRILYQFDVSSIPANSTIYYANLSMKSSTTTTAQSVSSYALTSAWDEGTGSGGSGDLMAVNWTTRSGSTGWTTAGGDYNSTAISTVTVGASSVYYQFPITQAVQWWTSGQLANNGIIMIATSGSSHGWNSRESTTNKPYVNISYMEPIPNVTWFSPANGTKQTSKTFNMWCNVTMAGLDSNANITELEIYLYNSTQEWAIDSYGEVFNSTQPRNENVSGWVNWTKTVDYDDAYYWSCSGVVTYYDANPVYEVGWSGGFPFSPAHYITIDSTPPAVTYQTPTPTDSSRQTGNSVTINTSVLDALSSIDTCILQWNNTATMTNYTMTKTNGICNYTIATTDGTNYWFRVWANDSMGNLGSTSTRTFKENTPPTISSIILTPSSPYRNDTLICTGASTDAESDFPIYLYQFNDSDGSVIQGYTGINSTQQKQNSPVDILSTGFTNPSSAYDRDWETFSLGTTGQTEYHYLNYTTMSNIAKLESKWCGLENILNISCYTGTGWNQIRYDSNINCNTPSQLNNSIPANCLNSPKLQIRVQAQSITYQNKFFEEQIWWNVSTNLFNCSSYSQCTKNDNITCNVKVYDGYEYSSINSTNVTILNFPPQIASWNISNSTWSTNTGTNINIYENSSGGTYTFNVTGVTDVDLSETQGYDWFIDGGRRTTNYAQSWFNWVLGSDTLASHNVTVYVNDTSNAKTSQYWNITILDTIAPILSNSIVSPASPSTYASGQVYRFNITATDTHINNVWIEFNGTNYTTQITNISSVYMFNRTDLSAGSYSYKWWANDTTNNKANSSTGTYTINTAINTLTLNSSKNWTYNYDQNPTNLSCTATFGTPNIYVDNVLISNPNVSSWNVGVHTVVCNITTSQNYSTATNTTTLTVNRIASTTSLTFDPASPQNYGTQINASCNSTGDGTLKLYRNNVDVTATELSQLITLAGGTHNYICNITTGANYQNSSTTGSYTINKVAGNISLLLNGVNNNLSITYPATSNASASTLYGSVTIYDNGAVITSQNNQNIVRSAGNHNITAVSSGDENHSSASLTWWIIESQASRTCSLTTDKEWTRTYDGTGSTTSCSASAGSTDGSMIFNLTIGTSTWNVASPDVSSPNVNSYIYACQWGSGVNYTSCAVNTSTLVINKASTTTTLTIAPASPVNYLTASNFSCSNSAGGTTILYINSIDKSSEKGLNIVRSAGSYTVNCSYAGDSNHNESSQNSTYTINKIAPSGSLTNSTSLTIAEGTQITIGLSESNTGDGDVTYVVYRDGISKGTGETWTPSLGTYIYILNTTGGTNYTANASMDTKTLTVTDTTPPAISIIYPQNISYNAILTEINYTRSDTNLQACWYSTDAGSTNTTISNCNNVTGLTAIQGSQTWLVGANDSSNNINSSKVTFFVDTVYPLIDWGNNVAYDGANLSQSNVYINVTWTEINFANITFRLYNDIATINTTTYTTPTYSINFTNLLNTNYSYEVNITDILNNKNGTGRRYITLDTTLPNATLIFPTNNTYNSTQSQNFTSNLTDNSGIKNATLYIYNETGQYNATTTEFIPSTTQKILGIVVYLVDGVYHWWVSVWDWANNNNVSQNNTLIIDTIKPNIYFNPSSNSNGTWKQSGDILINITATDVNLDTVKLDFNNVNQSFSSSGGNSYWINKIGLSTGTYTFYAWANDSASNFNTTGLRTIHIDLEDPIVSIIAPATGSSFGNNVSLLFNFTASDTNLQACWWNLDGGTNASITCNTTTTFNVSEGNHVIYAYSNDSSGRIGNTSSSFAINLQAPEFSPAYYPSDNLWINYGQNIGFNYTVSDTDLDACRFYTNSSGSWQVNQTHYPTSGVLDTFTISLPDGSINWNILCNDSSNKLTFLKSTNLTLNVDTIYPQISYGSGTESSATNFSRNWIYVDTLWTEINFASITFTLKNDMGIVNSTTYTSPVYSINWTDLPDANYTYYVNITDKTGNKNSTELRTIRLDTLPPDLTFFFPQTGNSYNYNDSVNLNFTAIDSGVGVDSCWFDLYNSSGHYFYLGSTIPNCQNTTFSVPSGDIDYTLTLWSNDTLNNIRGEDISFGIRTVSPATNIGIPEDYYFPYLTNILLNTTSTDADGVNTCKLYGNWTGSWQINQTKTGITSGASFNWNAINLPEGTYLMAVLCNDSYGNSGFSLNRTFGADITYPIVNITNIATTPNSQTIKFYYNITETNPLSCFYSIFDSTGAINGLNNNVSISCTGNNDSATVSAYATYNLTIYARDKAKNENSSRKGFTTNQESKEGGGGGGETIIITEKGKVSQLSQNFSFDTSLIDISLAKDSVSPRVKTVYLINRLRLPVDINLECDTLSANKSSKNINICNYVTFENKTLTLSPNELDRTPVTFKVMTPPNSSYSDAFYFNLLAVNYVDGNNSYYAKLSVSAKVSYLSTLIGKWSYLSEERKITYPVAPVSLFISFLLFAIVFFSFRAFKLPLTGLMIGLFLFFASFFLLSVLL